MADGLWYPPPMTDLLLSFRLRAVLAACSVVLLTACPPATTPEDAGPTPTEDAGVEPVNDGGTAAPDAGDTMPDAGGDAPDAGDTTPDAGDNPPEDAGVAPVEDAGTNPSDAGSSVEPPADSGALPADFGPVQCRDNSDCGGGTCNRTAPGGICSGGPCPDGTEMNFGACVRDCSDDDDCSAGMECKSNGYCGLVTCDMDDDCPAPYVCGAVGCERPSCSSSCPGDMVCADNLCMEP